MTGQFIAFNTRFNYASVVLQRRVESVSLLCNDGEVTQLLRISGNEPTLLDATSMKAQGKSEQRDLEQWVVQFPELIDPTLKVVATQFNRWESSVGSALERLDVLALATSGELVVIELKREGDRNIHLQAMTYAALVSGFTERTIAQAHADWQSRQRGTTVSPEVALDELKSHVDSWSENLLRQVRVVLVAESYPPQVLTTVDWLRSVAPSLQIECHEYSVFEDGGVLTVSFDRLYPVVDIESQLLKPGAGRPSVDEEQRASNQRRAKSVAVLHEYKSIPDGARITLDLKGSARAEIADLVDQWVAADPSRAEFTWHSHPSHPLRWAASSDPAKKWTPSALRNEIFRQAGAPEPSFSAADAWTFRGKNFYELANEALAASDNGG